MNTKFTKGPWRVRGDESVMVFADAGLEHIAACVTEDLPLSAQKSTGRSMTTDEALLAAGQALEECLRIVNQPFELEPFNG